MITKFLRSLRGKYGRNELEKHGQQHESESPDASGNFPFHQARCVFHDFMKCRWNKAGDNESHAFLNPDTDDAQDTGGNSHATSFKGVRHEETVPSQ